MARVVQKQKNPLLPVLVVFVFLFLISATLAVLFYNQADKAKLQQEKDQALLDKVANSRERKIPAIEALIKEAGTRKGTLTAPTAVGALYQSNQDISAIVLGTPAENTEQVNNAVAALRGEINSNLPLLEEIKQAYALINQYKEQIASLEADKQNYIELHKQSIDAGKQLESQTSAELQALQQEQLKLSQRADLTQKESIDKMAALDRQYLEKLNDKEKENQKFIAKVQEQDLAIQALKIQLDRERQKNQPIRTETGEPIVTITPDGVIRKVFTDHPVCFIPLGSKDKIVRGMTFRVYGAEGIPPDGSGHKASIVVTDVLEYVSQCRIDPVQNASPVATGDYFANIAYDPAHTSTFVVEGEFDLFATGRASQLGTQQVIDIIKRSGGNVSDRLSVHTDYVVVGEEPAMPPKPEEDAPEAVRQHYREREAIANRYQEVLKQATDLNIPILNTKRFLALTGYDPRNTLQ